MVGRIWQAKLLPKWGRGQGGPRPPLVDFGGTLACRNLTECSMTRSTGTAPPALPPHTCPVTAKGARRKSRRPRMNVGPAYRGNPHQTSGEAQQHSSRAGNQLQITSRRSKNNFRRHDRRTSRLCDKSVEVSPEQAVKRQPDGVDIASPDHPTPQPQLRNSSNQQRFEAERPATVGLTCQPWNDSERGL